MRKLLKPVAIAVLCSLAPGVAAAWAAPTSGATALVAVASSDVSAAAVPAPASTAGPRPSIRGSVEALRQSSLVRLPNPPARTDRAAAQSGGRRHMSSAAKAAIWIAALTVTGAWAYKTFSVTRGTD